MSTHSQKLYWIHIWKLKGLIDKDRSLPPVCKTVAWQLLDHYNLETGKCFPSHQTLSEECNYKLSKKDGLCTTYWNSGGIKEKGHYIEDIKDGVWSWFSEGGQEIEYVSYWKGKMTRKSVSTYDENNMLVNLEMVNFMDKVRQRKLMEVNMLVNSKKVNITGKAQLRWRVINMLVNLKKVNLMAKVL